MTEDRALTETIRHRAASMPRPFVVALDGRSGSGKSTLAAGLAAELDAVVIAGDDFWSGGADAEWAARTPAERVAQVIDWRRLRTEVLEPLLAGRPATWHPFDFAAGSGRAPQPITSHPAAVIILDGSYSARPELADLVDLAVLVDVPDDQVRRQRLLAREGPVFMAGWHALWDESEDLYFGTIRPRTSFDWVVTSST